MSTNLMAWLVTLVFTSLTVIITLAKMHYDQKKMSTKSFDKKMTRGARPGPTMALLIAGTAVVIFAHLVG